jgi:hypothetical protein
MVCEHNLQAAHCLEAPVLDRSVVFPNGDRWWRVWACPDHLTGLTGLREFGRRR